MDYRDSNYVRNYNSNNIYHAINVWAEYKTSFNDVHNISVMGGYNQEEKSYANTSYTMTDLYDNELPISDLAINYKDNAEGADLACTGGFLSFELRLSFQIST